jgi:hypothetical protein
LLLGVVDFDPNGAVADFDGIGGNVDVGDVPADTVLELELPLMPGAGDLAVVDEALVKRSAAMGTDVVDGKKTVGVAEEADRKVAEFKTAALANGNVIEFPRSIDVGHGGDCYFKPAGLDGKKECRMPGA